MQETDNLKAVISHYSPRTAKLAAVEILLADPASLADDVLESCLYILRDRLTEDTAGTTGTPQAPYPNLPQPQLPC